MFVFSQTLALPFLFVGDGDVRVPRSTRTTAAGELVGWLPQAPPHHDETHLVIAAVRRGAGDAPRQAIQVHSLSILTLVPCSL